MDTKRTLFIILFLVIFNMLFSQTENLNDTVKWYVGNIPFNKETDNPDFKPGFHYITTYPAFHRGHMHKKGKAEVASYFIKNYISPTESDDSGYITVRFMINTEGNSGRFRMDQMDNNYKEYTFDASISNQIFELAKELKDWRKGKGYKYTFPYYQYLLFKIENGNITEIMP